MAVESGNRFWDILPIVKTLWRRPLIEKLALSGNLSWFQRFDEVYLYHDLIGFILKMSPDVHELVTWFEQPHTWEEALAKFGRLYPEEMLREMIETLESHRVLVGPDEDELAALRDWVPVKARWRVAYTDHDGTVTLVLSRTSSEPPRFRVLDEFESRLWGLVDDQRSVRILTEELTGEEEAREEDLARVQGILASWTHHDAQVVKLHEVPMSFYRARMYAVPPYLTSNMPYEPLAQPSPNPQFKGPVVDLRDYHLRDIVDPTLQFDEVETTLNHLFREPHRALHGRTYPGQMLHVLVDRGILSKPGARIVEVGGGTGTFARGFLGDLEREHPDLLPGVSYTVVELSPALAASQEAMLQGYRGVARVIQGDAHRLDLPDGSVDLLISNEMIGDLESARVSLDELEHPEREPRHSSPEALEMIRRHSIPVQDGPESFHINLGAMKLVERAYRVLAPGGWALFTEFGEEHAYPRESVHLDHAEFSIHFGHVRHVAESVGFETTFEFLMDFLDMDRTLYTLATTRTYLRNLQALFARHGRRLLKLAYTREDLEALAEGALDLDRVEALHFDKIEDRICGLVPHHFKILLCHKPG